MREVAKLKEALNSLSQLSFSSGTPSKRLQQNQQLETVQQQVKQLQYQLTVRTTHPPGLFLFFTLHSGDMVVVRQNAT